MPPQFRRPPGIALALAALACLLLWLPAQALAARSILPPERLPSDHWSWDDLEELAVAGDLDSLWVYTRPLTRPEVAWALLRAPRSGSRDPRLARMARQFAAEIHALDPEAPAPLIRPLAHEEGEDASLRIWPAIRAGVSRDRGGKWRAGRESQFGGQGGFYLHPRTLFYAEFAEREYPGSHLYAEPLFSNTDVTALAQRVYVAAAGRVVRVAFGRDRVRWGLGQTGSLVFGDAAPPANFFEYAVTWRGFHGTVLTQQLDGFTGEYLSGHRVEWRAHPRLQIGITETARYRSAQPDWLYLCGFTPYTVVQRLNFADSRRDPGQPDLAARNNIMACVEALWRPRSGVQLGAALLVDEKSLADSLPARMGWQANVLWTQRGVSRPWTLRAEYTRVDNYVYAVYYGRNYIHQDASTAYPLGPDVRRATARLGYDPSGALKAWLSADYMDKGEGRLGDFLDSLGIFNPQNPQTPPAQLKGVVEHAMEVRLGARYLVRADVHAEVELGWGHARNAAHVAGRKESELVGRFALEWRR